MTLLFPLARQFRLLLGALLLAASLAFSQGAERTGSEVNPAPFLSIHPLQVPTQGHAGFTRLPGSLTGIAFTNSVSTTRSLTNHILLNGSGIAAGDIDGDGLCDLYFCGLDGPNALYRNLGNWHFEEIAAKAGVDCPDLDATGAAFADIDGDGDLDLLVTAIRRGVSCFLNDGHGHFTEVNQAWGLGGTTAGMTLALADIDGDSDLDLYLSNYRNETLRDGFQMQIRVGMANGKRVVTRVNGRALIGPDLAGWVTLDENGNIQENGQADILFRNVDGTRFEPVPFTSGNFLDETGKPLSSPLYDWTLTGMFRDLNDDGLPDLYVCSDMASPDRIWINQGQGRFRAAPVTMIRKTSWFSMGVDVGDLDRDGFDDLFVTDMVSRDPRLRQTQVSDHQPVFSVPGEILNRPQTPRNTLFKNRGDGTYAEIAFLSQLHATDWSWSPVFLDVDLDGYEDILVTTGFERDVQDADIANELETARRERRLTDAQALALRAKFPRLSQPNLAFRNLGHFQFSEVSKAWGFDEISVAQGIALADLDGDGDLDLVVNNMNAPASVYRNDASEPRIAISLKGAGKNSSGIGAKIKLLGGAVPSQQQEMQSGGRYLSSDQALRVFAAGHATNQLSIEVSWPSGRISEFQNIPANASVRITEDPSTPIQPRTARTNAEPSLFENTSARLNHHHRETAFNDFEVQPLLPRKLSQDGPGIAWADLDGDGREDLVVGGGRGGTLDALRNEGDGSFTPFPRAAPPDATEQLGQTGILILPNSNAPPTLLHGVSPFGSRQSRTEGVRARQGFSAISTPLTNAPVSTGPIIAADIDGDGALEIFVGGHSVPGRFPEASPSKLYRQTPQGFIEDSARSDLLKDLGRVNGAVFSDLDGDGFPELMVTCDWGPIRILRNSKGLLTPWDPPLVWSTRSSIHNRAAQPTNFITLSALTGWWNGITTGDFNGDGRLDIVACNWGQNHKYQEQRSHPLRLYFGNFSDSGGLDVLEGYFDSRRDQWFPWMHLGRVAPAIPDVGRRYHSFGAYANASMADILGPKASAAQILEAVWLESTVFLNTPQGFIPMVLPGPAQWSPAFAPCVADFDGDGNEDLFISQNFFATEPETARYDAGRGLCLLGSGSGDFNPLGSLKSGIAIDGEQRGAALADFDADGRPDLAVTQNGSQTQLLHNQGAKPGLRVRFQGPPTNPSGIGAVIRLRFGDTLGPARECRAGSGYWSQDSPVLVLATPTPPTAAEVTWPGGAKTTTPIPTTTRELRIPAPSVRQ